MTFLSFMVCFLTMKFYDWSKRDWMIFIRGVLIGNAYWMLACYVGITLVEWVWKMIINA